MKTFFGGSRVEEDCLCYSIMIKTSGEFSPPLTFLNIQPYISFPPLLAYLTNITVKFHFTKIGWGQDHFIKIIFPDKMENTNLIWELLCGGESRDLEPSE